MTPRATHTTALLMLLLASCFWGLAFPLTKAIVGLHLQLLPDSGTWFVTAMTTGPRFLLGAIFFVIFARHQLANATRDEIRQGLLLGGSASVAQLLQTDGLQFTSASIAAFFVQFYVVTIPIYAAVRTRRSPGRTVWFCSALVVAGAAIFSRFDFSRPHLGRGELEMLAASVFVMIQILSLGDSKFRANRVFPVIAIMFAIEASVFTGLACATAPAAAAVLAPWMSPPWLALTLLLTGLCTIGAFTLMNLWQPAITVIEASLIYSTEPIFATAMALFLPAYFSRWTGISYSNESLTWQLLVGGGLITLANVLIQLASSQEQRLPHAMRN